MKAFLFGGTSNGKTLSLDNHVQIVDMPKHPLYVSYSNDNSIKTVYETEKYVKYNEQFRKRLNNSNVVLEMEDLGIFIHESISADEIESLAKIIIMVINAQWNPVKRH